jgi:hypothetical protein
MEAIACSTNLNPSMFNNTSSWEAASAGVFLGLLLIGFDMKTGMA